jgi:hypothetical protein
MLRRGCKSVTTYDPMQCNAVSPHHQVENMPSRDFKRDRPSLTIMAMLKSDADLTVSAKPSTGRVSERLRLLQLVGDPSPLSGWGFKLISSRPWGKLLGKHNVSQDDLNLTYTRYYQESGMQKRSCWQWQSSVVSTSPRPWVPGCGT